jgi:hypothetical protein
MSEENNKIKYYAGTFIAVGLVTLIISGLLTIDGRLKISSAAVVDIFAILITFLTSEWIIFKYCEKDEHTKRIAETREAQYKFMQSGRHLVKK